MYGVVLLLAAVSYYLLQRAILVRQEEESVLREALGRDLKGKLSPAIYVAGIATALVRPWIAGILYALVALIWLVPDRRMERILARDRAVVSHA